ncbi:TNF receptor-associated factor homolog 1a-like [Prosopis cineraria]|uniref:TNF receptor-associated factor homolog 1a-like n=1 Tax=Prosopis cineraria TaxID=364024 RepID=UPI00240F3013|nr:TNF receptor-associated factor homolog 1a-like [Prosopis cineraria]
MLGTEAMKICCCFPYTGGRKAPPSHCLFTINSFSLLSEPYTSEKFEAGGYEWTLSVYPSGNKKRDGDHHISIYLNLIVQNSNLIPVGWEVNAITNLFVYDCLRDEYLSTQDASIRRFHELQTEWGIPKFIDLVSFNEPSNGYLMEDSCTFGAEIFVVKPTYQGLNISLRQEPPSLFYRWKFNNFSNSKFESYVSETFMAGDYKWKLTFYPNGFSEAWGNSISLFLTIDESSIPENTKLYVHCILRARDQINEQHVEEDFYRHFSKSNRLWGSRLFVPLAKLTDPTKGFLQRDSCIFEAEFKILGIVEMSI